ncbi:MAG: TIGR02117 family protein [Mesorhizobium sp.]|nr:TIGR02117 family protein [Mesorhizobium sp.]
MAERRRGRLAATARYLLIAVFGLAALAALGIVVPRPLLGPPGLPEGGAMRQILVLANPIHTDIAFPADADVLARLGFAAADGLELDHPGVYWVHFGWGSRSFYIETPTWAELSPGPVLRAFSIDESAMHVGMAGDIDPAMEGVLPLAVSEAAMFAMLDEVLSTFERDGEGRPILIPGASYGEFDLFYEAHSRFNALYGCNEWTSRILRAGGIRTGWWNPLPPSLLWSIRLGNEFSPG